MDKKLFSPLMSAANNIVKVQRPLTKRAQDYNAFINFLSTSNKDIKRIKLPEKKKVKFLADNGITFTGAGGRKGIIPDLIKGIGGGLLGGLGLKGLSKAKIPQLLKPKTKVKTKTPLTAKSLRTLKPKGRIPKIRGIAEPLNLVLAGLEYGGRLGEGQTQEQAILGTAGSVVGGIGGAQAGAAAGAAIGALFGGVGAVPGAIIGRLIGGIGGSIAGGSLLDKMTGVEEKPKDKIEKRLKRQERIQKERAEKSGITLNDIVIKFERVISKFEKVTLGMTGVDTSDKGKQKKGKDEGLDFDENSNEGSGGAPSTPSEPYDGPISKDTFFPLPRGIVSNRSVGVQGGEYGAPRNYGGHSGQDIGGLPPGSPVVAWKTGKVRYSGSVEPGDTIITIDHGNGEQSVYKHVVPTVAPGTVVYGGQQIASLFAAKAYAEHLHFEVWKNGSHTDPNGYLSSAQKISSPLSPEKAKAESEKSKVSAQSGVMGQSGKPTAVLMAGTNDYGDPTKGALGVKQAIKNLQNKGFHVVVVPPSEVGQTAEVSKQVQEVATQMGATVRKGQYKPTDDSGAIGYAHLTQASADAIARDYKGATFVGDSNAQMIPGAKIAATSKSASTIASMINEQISSAGPAVQPAPQTAPQVQPPIAPTGVTPSMMILSPQQQSAIQPQSIPVPIPMRGGGSGGVTVISPDEGEILNSLWKTMLLTNLSAA